KLVHGDDVTSAGKVAAWPQPAAAALALGAALLAKLAIEDDQTQHSRRPFTDDVVAAGSRKALGAEFPGALLMPVATAEGDHRRSDASRRSAGRSQPLIADDAIARLHNASLGLIRALNNLAMAALIATAIQRKDLGDDDCAKQAVAELNRDRE